MGWLEFLGTTIARQEVMQIFVGGCTMLLIGWMVTRARGDKEHLPAAGSRNTGRRAGAVPTGTARGR